MKQIEPEQQVQNMATPQDETRQNKTAKREAKEAAVSRYLFTTHTLFQLSASPPLPLSMCCRDRLSGMDLMVHAVSLSRPLISYDMPPVLLFHLFEILCLCNCGSNDS